MGKTKPANAGDLLAAIHRKCLECSGESRNEVLSCRVADCPLFPFRCNAVKSGPVQEVLDGQIGFFDKEPRKGRKA